MVGVTYHIGQTVTFHNYRHHEDYSGVIKELINEGGWDTAIVEVKYEDEYGPCFRREIVYLRDIK